MGFFGSFILQNSIRHNLSLHSRFKRIQNEGQGKSSWWMMNPEAAKLGPGGANSNPPPPAKHCHHYHHRKRSNTLESGLIEKRRPTNSHVKRRISSGSITPLTG